MNKTLEPLAAQLRPQTLDDVVGQTHLLAPNKPFRIALEKGQLHSCIFWGPPGTGKTTLAQLMAQKTQAHFVQLSAVFSGVKDIREAVNVAEAKKNTLEQKTILFVDEIHRFNKAQQDAFLPYMENGLLTVIGATTENPSFALNNALLSRAKVYVLKALSEAEISLILQRALALNHKNLPDAQLSLLSMAADGDARRALNFLETVLALMESTAELSLEQVKEIVQGHYHRFDKQGDIFYDLISALHKSVRGSDPNAALYWLMRMLDAGCDPLYLARRIVRMATEDIGNADPRALTLAIEAWQTVERLGQPEGELALAQAILYLAIAAKSNAVYTAFNAARAFVKESGSLEVPLHLRNAPTHLMRELNYGKEYRYAHDEPYAYAAGEHYWPEGMKPQVFYQPTDRGLEIKMAEKLAFLKKLDEEYKQKC